MPDGLLLASEAGAEVPARAARAEADAGDDLGAAGHRVLQLLQPRHAPVNLRIPTQPNTPAETRQLPRKTKSNELNRASVPVRSLPS